MSSCIHHLVKALYFWLAVAPYQMIKCSLRRERIFMNYDDSIENKWLIGTPVRLYMEMCCSKVCRIRESWNSGMVWVGTDIKKHLVPISCLGLHEKGVCANIVTPREGNSLGESGHGVTRTMFLPSHWCRTSWCRVWAVLESQHKTACSFLAFTSLCQEVVKFPDTLRTAGHKHFQSR